MKVEMQIPEMLILERTVTIDAQDSIDLFKKASKLVKELQKEYLEAGANLKIRARYGNSVEEGKVVMTHRHFSISLQRQFIEKLMKTLPEVNIKIKFGDPIYKGLYYYSIGYEERVSKITAVKLRAAGLIKNEVLTDKGRALFDSVRAQGPKKRATLDSYIMEKLLAFGSYYTDFNGLKCFSGGAYSTGPEGYIGDWLYSIGLMSGDNGKFSWNDASRKWIVTRKTAAMDMALSEQQKTALMDCLSVEDLPRYLVDNNEVVRAVAKLKMEALSLT